MDLEERRDLLNEKMAEQIEILPGQSLDEAQIAKFLKAIQGHLHAGRRSMLKSICLAGERHISQHLRIRTR